jgi:FtsZ-binding cell division protein ZapB
MMQNMMQKFLKIVTVNRVLVALLLIFGVTIVVFAARWIEASNTVELNKEQINVLTATVSGHEETIETLSEQNAGYVADIEKLTIEVGSASEANAILIAEKTQIETEKNELATVNGQLKAENGDLSKKFKILSGPS